MTSPMPFQLKYCMPTASVNVSEHSELEAFIAFVRKSLYVLRTRVPCDKYSGSACLAEKSASVWNCSLVLMIGLSLLCSL
jgi:hypothetical protein